MAKSGIFEFFDFVAMYLLAVQEGAGPQPSRIKIIQNWIVNNAKANLFFPYKCHGNGNKWNMPNEIVGAINWIYDPSGLLSQCIRCFRLLSNESAVTNMIPKRI